MNNLELLKKELYNDDFLIDYFCLKKEDIDKINPNQIASLINFDCTICLCYGCRRMTNNYNKEYFKKQECFEYIKDYFSRDFNPDTDLCQCPSCRKRRNEDNDKHTWKLSYDNQVYYIYENNLPEAKSYAINQGIFAPENYPFIKGELIIDDTKRKGTG